MTDDPPDPPASSATPQVEADLVAELDAAARGLEHPDAPEDLVARFAWLVDVLIKRGHLAPGHRKLIDRVRADRNTFELADERGDNAPSADLDCASLLHLCHARCCSFKVTLSPSEVERRVLSWEVKKPYVLPQHFTGYCVHLQRDGGCGVYADRPGTCRVYDCRQDRRIWLDFANKIPAPMRDGVVPLGDWPEDEG